MTRYHDGYVVASNLPEGTSPTITYTVKVNYTDEAGVESVRTYENVKPADGRWAPPWIVLACPPGTEITMRERPAGMAFMFGGAEKLAPVECP